MNSLTALATTVLPVRNLVSRSPLWRGFLLVALAPVWFALSPIARAQLSPPPDGGYPNENTAEGDAALFSLTTGADNTANGFQALYSNTTGNENTANGVNALFFNTANDNTATGFEALYSNTTGADDTANGVNALLSNTTGSQNTANGVGTLKQNTTGHANTANGYRALYINTTGNANTANGIQALYSNTTGSQNTAQGLNALANNTIGSNNIALGVSAGLNLTTGSNNIDIGALGVAGESGVIRIGKTSTATATFIAGISGKTVPSGVGVIVNASGQLGTILSSVRFKEAIKPMDKASEALLALKPVTFRYKHELDPDGIPQFGLVAEQVEKVNPDLVVRGADGKVNTVRYEAVNAMLLNEFLKEHRKVEKLEKDLRSTIAQQQKQIEALTATIQKVSDQVAHSDLAPQLVVNP
jgi:Chaperone of endosialidase